MKTTVHILKVSYSFFITRQFPAKIEVKSYHFILFGKKLLNIYFIFACIE